MEGLSGCQACLPGNTTTRCGYCISKQCNSCNRTGNLQDISLGALATMEPRRSISNSVVKHCGGDNTFWATGREDSLVPRDTVHLLLIEDKELKKQKPFSKGEGWEGSAPPSHCFAMQTRSPEHQIPMKPVKSPRRELIQI
jgi:hypothetical protein